ncbi:alanine racemase [Microbacterium sp. NPDC056234]|uniref:alanine racemase n=1 Tax=Microbacterium sp. NPDC056234 TaxID=3345757 RepID=UPI0035D84569
MSLVQPGTDARRGNGCTTDSPRIAVQAFPRRAAALVPSSRMQPPTLRIDSSAVAANIARVRQATTSDIMAVVKADGYGHGAVAVAQAAVAAGATWLGITDVAEAVTLREAGLEQPVLAWLNPAGADAALAADLRVDVAVGSAEELRQLIAGADRPLRVHLQMDTGMSRGGSPLAEWGDLLRIARDGRAQGRIAVVGVMGHLPLADRADPAANAPAVLRMRQARDAVLRAGFGPLTVHLAATAGALTDSETHFDLVRVGAGLVGIDPSDTVVLRGAGTFTAPVVHSIRASAGTAVGYGAQHVAPADTHLSVIGAGYADGIPRSLASGASVEIGGRRHPIVGRVSMDQIVVDTGAVAVARGTIATVFGPAGTAAPTIQEWAHWAETIPHTIVTGIGPRIRRSTS